MKRSDRLINPHIVRRLRSTKKHPLPIFQNHTWVKYAMRSGGDDDSKETVEIRKAVESVKVIQDRFARAKQVAKDCPAPLAYRLDIETEEIKQDDLGISKFGGVPDLRYFFYRRDKERAPTALKYLERLWPKCSACHGYMKFIGQVDITEWLVALMSLTWTAPEKKYDWVKKDSQRFFESYSSGVGYMFRTYQYWPNIRLWHRFFLCQEFHHLDMISNSQVLVENRMGGFGLGGPWKAPWSDEAFLKAGQQFIKKHLSPEDDDTHGFVPLQRVTNTSVRFDVEDSGLDYDYDTPERKRIEAVQELAYDYNKKVDPAVLDLFQSVGPYQMFGTRHSQQDEVRSRLYCQWPFDSPHVQAPILMWNDHHNDITHQMVGCMSHNGDNHHERILATTESSST